MAASHSGNIALAICADAEIERRQLAYHIHVRYIKGFKTKELHLRFDTP